MLRFTLVCTLLLSFYFGNTQERALDTSSNHIDSINISNKPIISAETIYNWNYISSEVGMSGSGLFLCYTIQNQPVGNKTLIVRSADGSWQKEFIGAVPITFSTDNKSFVFLNNDVLNLLDFETQKIELLDNNVTSWKASKEMLSDWVVWTSKSNPKELIIFNIVQRKKYRFNSVIEAEFGNNGQVVVIKAVDENTDSTQLSLSWFDLNKQKSYPVWVKRFKNNDNANVPVISIDDTDSQLAFIVQEKDKDNRSIWYYNPNMEWATVKISNNELNIDSTLHIGNYLRFSHDGQYLYFNLEVFSNYNITKSKTLVDIWSYRDTILQSTQLGNTDNLLVRPYSMVIGIKDKKVNRLDRNIGDYVKEEPVFKGDYIVHSNNAKGDRFWIQESERNWVLSLKTGERTLLNTKGYTQFSFSPNGRFLVYYDAGQGKNYFSYDLATGKTVNLTASLPLGLFSYLDEFYHLDNNSRKNVIFKSNVGIAAWLEGDSSILIYDNYDIWQFDLYGQKKPINVTKGYGRNHSVKLRFLSPPNKMINLSKNEPQILTAFCLLNKYNGFFSLVIRARHLQELSMGPYTIYHSGTYVLPLNPHDFNESKRPIKAKNANIWLVKRESYNAAPNLFLTKDFVTYSMITDLQPQKQYNWLTAELVTWRQADGLVSHGVLYKPENFSPYKKYPVIINFYQQLSHRLYQFPEPGFTNCGDINIPWFVSRGYLVFTPDIHFIEGKKGESGLKSVMSAVQALARKNFIDPKRMAYTGHSFAGQISYYIATHSKIFAAGIASAGTSDQISSSLQLSGGITKFKSRLEVAESFMAGSIWEKLNVYIGESPVFNADKISSPLLIFHNKNDRSVPWEQAIEMFIALRRLEKMVWMTQYDNGHHLLIGDDKIDFTIRVTQFFNHYLKTALAPVWMTKGIRASRKGFDTGFELDLEGNCGNGCKVCNKSLDRLSSFKRIP